MSEAWTPSNDAEAYAMRALLSLYVGDDGLDVQAGFRELTSLFANALAGQGPDEPVQRVGTVIQ